MFPRAFHDNSLCKTWGANRVHYGELENRELTPSLSNYQLLLVDATRGYSVTSFGKPQELVLLSANQQLDYKPEFSTSR